MWLSSSGQDSTETPRRLVGGKPLLALALVPAVFGVAMFLEPLGIQGLDEYRNNDWLSIVVFRSWLHRGVHELGQFPLWCPYLGGGYPTIQHPSDGSLTPFALPVLLFGHVVGVKLNLLLLVFGGGLGVYLLASDHLGIGRYGALFSALAFQASGWFPSMMAVGFYNLALYLLIPLILYFLVRAYAEWRFALPAGVLLGFFAHVAAMGTAVLVVFCGLLAVGHSLRLERRRPGVRWRPAAVLALTLAVGTGVAAVKLVGVWDLTQRGCYLHGSQQGCASMDEAGEAVGPFEYADKDWNDHFYESAAHFLRSAFSHAPRAPDTHPSGEPLSDEYAFLGIPWLAAPLFAAALFVVGRRSLPWVAAAAVVLWLCFGPNAPLDLYRITVLPAPVLRDISQFYKYANFFPLLVLVLLSGGALDGISSVEWLRRARSWCVLAALASLAPFAVIHATLLADRFAHPAAALPDAEGFHQVRAANDPRSGAAALLQREQIRPVGLREYDNLRRGVGTIDWYADIYLPESAVPAFWVNSRDGAATANDDYRGEAWFAGATGEVVDVAFDANTVDLLVDVAAPSTVVINQNHDARWRAKPGRVTDNDGLLAVDLGETGRYEVRLRFVPVNVYLGLAATLLTLGASACGWVWAGRRARGRRPARVR